MEYISAVGGRDNSSVVDVNVVGGMDNISVEDVTVVVVRVDSSVRNGNKKPEGLIAV